MCRRGAGGDVARHDLRHRRRRARRRRCCAGGSTTSRSLTMPVDGRAVVAHDHGTDPVLGQQGEQAARRSRRVRTVTTSVALAAQHVGDPHDADGRPPGGATARGTAQAQTPRVLRRRQRHDRASVCRQLPGIGSSRQIRLAGVDRVPQHPDLRPGRRRQPAARRPGRRRTTARSTWRRSPGGLVTAMESVMRGRDGAWVGWAGEAGRGAGAVRRGRHAPAPGAALRATRSRDYYEGFSNDTLWPIYHDVIVPATFHRDWWTTYRDGQPPLRRGGRRGRRRGRDRLGARLPAAARAGDAARAAPGRADRLVQPHPLPARRALRPAAVARAAGRGPARRRPPRLPAQRRRPQLPARLPAAAGAAPPRATPSARRAPTAGPRAVRASAIPISVDFRGPRGAGPHARGHASAPRRSASRLGNPETLLLGVDRLDYTKGIRHRLKAYEELLERRRRRPAGRPSSCRSPPRAASASRPTASCARRSRPTVGPHQRRVRRHRRARRPLPAPLLPPRGDGGAVPGRRRHAGHAAARRHEPRRQGVRHLPPRRRRRAGAVGVHRRLARAAPGLRLQPARHRRA